MNLFGAALVLALALAPPPPSPSCAATPADAWKNAKAAVAGKDAGAVTLTLTPDYRTRNSVEYAVGASMVAEIGGLSGSMSNSPGAAEKAKAAEKKLLAELDRILVKYKAPTIAQIGTPRLMKMQEPAVHARFAKIDHVGYAREMEAFFVKVEAAAKAAGVSGAPPKLDELVVGGGDLNAPLGEPKVSGENARATAGSTVMRFRKVDGCWLIDGREPLPN
ncbi:MAG TPA: hypothetical protein VFF17_12305 [Thermoanaerobaculia bacterium]|nr:hypothetical protein [Thermoanaerobaculia bacterium]